MYYMYTEVFSVANELEHARKMRQTNKIIHLDEFTTYIYCQYFMRYFMRKSIKKKKSEIRFLRHTIEGTFLLLAFIFHVNETQ